MGIGIVDLWLRFVPLNHLCQTILCFEHVLRLSLLLSKTRTKNLKACQFFEISKSLPANVEMMLMIEIEE